MPPYNYAIGVGPEWLVFIWFAFSMAIIYLGWRGQKKLFVMRQTPLVRAVLRSDLAAMRIALDGGADVNQLKNNMTPLLYAISRRDVAAAQFLLDNGADPNLRAKQDESPLWSAELEYGCANIAELLRSPRSDPRRGPTAQSVLELASH